MKWFKRKIAQWAKEGDDRYLLEGSGIKARVDEASPEGEPILNFRIYSANNGQILEFRSYDRVKDRSHSSTYIISKDQEIGEYVKKCLSLEFLK